MTSPIFLYIIGLLGSMAAFTAVLRIMQPPQEDSNSLARIAPKGPGEISPWESINPNGSVIDRLDLFLVYTLAVRGYEQVLESFPDSVTYDATGTIAYDLAPIAEAALQSIGAVPGEAASPLGDEEEGE